MITVLPGNPKDGTHDVKIRVIKVILDNGTKEYLATNIFDSEITQAMFRELYFYQANRAFIIGQMKLILPKILCCMYDLSAIDRLYPAGAFATAKLC